MKITNKTLAWFISVVLPLILFILSTIKYGIPSVNQHVPNGFEGICLRFNAIMVIVIGLAFLAGFVILIGALFEGDIRFEYEIKIPSFSSKNKFISDLSDEEIDREFELYKREKEKRYGSL